MKKFLIGLLAVFGVFAAEYIPPPFTSGTLTNMSMTNGFAFEVNTWSDLKALTIPANSGRMTALVKGRVSTNDGGGGTFFFTPGAGATDDGGTIATPNVGTGAWFRQYSGPLNVKWFGVIGNGVANDTVSLQRAYDAVHALGGGQVFFPKAAVTLNASITNYANIITKGSGVGVTVITFSNAGDGFVTSSPINTSTPLYSSYKDIEVVNSNGANTGGGIVDVAGTYGEISGCFVHGFKYEVILDQSELWRITGNTFTTVINNGADIWMVEGADRTVGALPGYCNGIWIKNNQFNNAGTTTSIIADGYDGNVISDNNFNAGSIGLRIGRACAIIIRGNNFEGQTSYSVQFNNTTSLGTSVVTSIGGLIQGNQFQSSVPVPLFLTSVYGVEIADNIFLQMATAGIQFDAPVSARNCYVHDNNKLLIGNGRTAAPFVSASTANYQDNQIAQLGQTYSVNSFGAGAQTVTVGTVEGFNANQTLFVVNADGSNPEQVVISTVVNSTSFTATFGLAHATNCLFHCIDKTTQNPVTFLDSFSTKQQKYVGQTVPAVSASGSGSIYFDSVTNVFNVSQNGGAYVPLISSGAPASTLVGPLTATAIPYASGTTNLANSPISRLSATDVGPTTDNGSTLGDTTHRLSGIFAMPLNASSNTVSLYDSSGTIASVFGPAGGLTLGGQVPPGAGNLQLSGTVRPITDATGTVGTAPLRWGGMFSTIYTANAGSISSDTPNVFSQQWNAGGVTFHGAKIVITNTASAAASEGLQILGGAAGTTEVAAVRVDGSFLSQNGAAATPSFSFVNDATTGFFRTASSVVGYSTGGTESIRFDNATGQFFRSDYGIAWASTTGFGTRDLQLTRVAASVIGIGNNSSGNGAWFQWGGDVRNSAQFDKTTDTTLANVTGLSITLTAGRTYNFKAHFDATLDTTGGGKYAIGGTCTATAINYRVRTDAASLARRSSARQTALGGTISATSTLTDDDIEIEGQITVNAGGTLTVQFAQSVSSGTSSVLAGGQMTAFDVP